MHASDICWGLEDLMSTRLRLHETMGTQICSVVKHLYWKNFVFPPKTISFLLYFAILWHHYQHVNRFFVHFVVADKKWRYPCQNVSRMSLISTKPQITCITIMRRITASTSSLIRAVSLQSVICLLTGNITFIVAAFGNRTVILLLWSLDKQYHRFALTYRDAKWDTFCIYTDMFEAGKKSDK